MANLIALGGRAVDENLALVTNATAYFYLVGSTTPLVVYSDNTLTTALGSSVAGDAEGVFPQCWTSLSKVKVDVRDASGVSLPGFPQDNFPTFPEGGQSADQITTSPVTGNAGTDAQAFMANNTARLNVRDNGAALVVSSGSGGAYAITANYTISAYAVLQEFEFIANHTNPGTSDTLNVDGQGATELRKYNTSAAKVALDADDISQGDVVRVKYDGTHFVMMKKPVTVSDFEASAIITESESIASNDNDTTIPTSAAAKDYSDSTQGWELVQTVYDSAVNGLVSNVETPVFEAGYDYAVEVYNLYGDTGTTTNTAQVYRDVADAYDAAVAVKASNANYWSARYEFLNPMSLRLQHWIKFSTSETVGTGALSLGVAAGEGTLTIKHASNDRLERFRIQRGAGSINNGTVRLYRRRTQA